MKALRLEHVSHHYGSLKAVDALDLDNVECRPWFPPTCPAGHNVVKSVIKMRALQPVGHVRPAVE